MSKRECDIIKDLLPSYVDEICSEASKEWIEEHLKECAQCRRVLTDLHSCIAIPEKPVDDLRALEGIQRKWKKRKWTYIGRGICITLIVL